LEAGAATGPPRDGQTLEAQLERLLATPTGSVIYDQLARIVAEWQGVDARVAQTYSGLLRLLLDDFACEPSSERVLYLVGRLIQMQPRHTVSLPVASITPTEFATRLADQDGFRAALVTLLERLHAVSPFPVPPQPKVAADGAREIRLGGQAGEPVGQRTNGVDRQHSERQHGEAGRVGNEQSRPRQEQAADKLQDTLALKMRDAMAKNKELGDLLRIEMGALQQIDNVEEAAAFRQIMIGGVEELLQGQSALAGSLDSTSDYLRIIESDSERLHDELHKARLMSLTDEFTGLPNRRAFMRRLEDEIGRAQRYDTPLSLAIVDLDEFKIINDTFGHVAGDQILRCYAEHMLSTFRHYDLVARYGGEEFSVLLPNTALEGAQRALSKVQSRVAKSQCEHDGRALLLPTFSAGLALYVPGEQPIRFIERADRALYRAKHLGRNRIELERPVGQSPTLTVTGNGSSGTPES
jgi:diguanylate cyclase (GGDEF)-like protein